MSYVTQNLLKDETVEYSATIHWIAYFTAVFWSLVGIILLLAHFVVGVLPLLYAAFKVLSILARELAVTNKRVIGKTGVIRRDSIELRHEKVETIRVDQTILGRILGYGTVTVRGTGSSIFGLREISNPLKFRREVDIAGDKPSATTAFQPLQSV
jgi:uncharacterized membrane protein YdbT with pleckstrin-like domain